MIIFSLNKNIEEMLMCLTNNNTILYIVATNSGLALQVAKYAF